MMDYLVAQDIESVMEITESTMENLADELGVSRITISNWVNNKNIITEKHIDAFYSYAYRKGIRLNKIKEQFYREDMIKENEVLLFHGAKTMIEGDLRIDCNKRINDFGNGFYCGESLEQSAMFVATHKKSSLYMLKFKASGLKCKEFRVDREWMLTIAYFRGRLEAYSDTEIVKQIAKSTEGIDYIVAPIADNRMFEIIDSFIDGEITDIQCQHCLSATNLGMQYVFISNKALSQINLLERCYLTELEKEAYLNSRQESFRMNLDKVKLARRQYRNQGEYIEEILK
jgi:transcriptional regulator with XRE-family HTH domain